jgi:hypothetical protein
MNINTDKVHFCKIVPVKEQLKVTKYRNGEMSETDENLRLIEDEVKGIIACGKGWCFYEHQLKAIVKKLQEKLSPEVFKTLNYHFDGYCYNITIKKTRKKYTRKDSVVEA